MQKRLHAHVLPFVVIACGLIVATTMLSAAWYGAQNGQSVTQLLGVRLYDMRPASNGLTSITKHSQTTTQKVQNAPSILGDDVGKNASLQASLYAEN